MTPTTTPGACVREAASPFSAVGGAGTVSSRAPVPAAPVSISWDQAVRGLPGAGGRVPRVTSFVVAPQTPESPAIRTGATDPFGCSSPQARASVAESLASKPLPVRHAGMVLLWPFLREWLTTQGLMAEGEFTDRAARIQAARQLCWLIGEDLGSEPGQTERPPSLLLVLCGLPLALRLAPGPPPAEEVLTQYQHWLRSVIAPNRELNRLGVQGFCERFLRRGGYLLHREALFQVRVEASSQDFVLHRLEWPWQRVDLPWLRRVLAVDWVPFDRLW